MVEFIVNLETGEFETQWDAYDQHKLPDGRYDSNPEHYTHDELHEIANTESFNYGPSKGIMTQSKEFMPVNIIDWMLRSRQTLNSGKSQEYLQI